MADAAENEDLLELDSTGWRPRDLARLALLMLAGATVSLVVSILLGLLGGGTIVDFVVLICWLGLAVQAVAAVLLFAGAGLSAVLNRPPSDRPA